MSNWFSEPMENEVPYSEIEAKSGSFHKWNFEPLTMQEIGYEGVNDKLREYTAERYEALDDEGKEKLVKEVLDIYRSVNLLPIQYYSEIGVMNEIEKCINYKAGFTGNTVSCVSGDTEYFNGENWVRIDSYKDGDMVLQFNPDGTAELVDPIKYIHTKNNDKFYVVGENGCSMVLTGNHDVVFVDDSTNELTKRSVDEIIRSMRGDLAVLKVPVCCEMKDNMYSLDVQTNMIAWIINGIITGNESDCEFLQRLPNGTICFTDKIFRLNRSSRKQMLSMLGIDRCYSMDMFSEELAKQVATLYNMTYFGNIKGVTYPADHSMTYNAFHGSLIGDGNMYERRVVTSGRDEIVGMDDPRFIRSCCRLYDFNNGRYRVLNGEEKGYDFSFMDKYCFEVPSHMLVLRRKGYMFVTGNCGAGVGTTLCNYLFPNLFDVPSKHDLDKKDAETLFKKFHNDAYLSRAIKFCFSYKNGCPTPTNVMGGLRLVGRAPTNFRPMNAKAVYERFCPEGGTVYDFCCGFGGRLLGCLSSKKNFRYVGTDPCVETMYHLHELGDYIEMVTGRDDSYELHCCGSEDFRGPAESVDFAFSSPPYFDLEVYSTDETQCFNKFPELDQWLEGYVRATIKNIKYMLKRGCVYAVNIADFTVGGGNTVAYVDEWIRISTEEGMPLYDTVYLGVTARAGSAQQAAGELKKENILIFKKPL